MKKYLAIVTGLLIYFSGIEPVHSQTFLGTNFTGSAQSYDTQIQVYNGVTYIAFADELSGGQIWVKSWDGTSWNSISVVAAGNAVTSESDNVKFMITSTGVPVIAYKDFNTGSLVVKKYESNTWTAIGNVGMNVNSSSTASLALDANDVPYVCLRDESNSGRLLLKKWDGTQWATVGSTHVSSTGASSNQVVFDKNNNPYVLSHESDWRVYKYDGSGWNLFGGGSIAGAYFSTQMCYNATDQEMIVAYTKNDNNIEMVRASTNAGTWSTIDLTGFQQYTTQLRGVYYKNGLLYIYQASSGMAYMQRYDGASWFLFNTFSIPGNGRLSSHKFTYINDNLFHCSYVTNSNEGKVVALSAAPSIRVTYSGAAPVGGKFDFGTVNYGDWQTVTITNIGGTTLNISSITNTYGNDLLDIANTDLQIPSLGSTTFKILPKEASSNNFQINSDAVNFPTLTFYITISAINPKNLTIDGVTSLDKEYDGSTVATPQGGTLQGILSGDNVNLVTGTGTFSDKNVGVNKTVTYSDWSLSGNEAAYYSITQPASTTANITPTDISISAISVNDKVYDGTTSATISSVTFSGILGTDEVQYGGSAAFSSTNAGSNISVALNGNTLSGTDAANYNLPVLPGTITASITKAPLNITADNISRTYGGANPILTMTFDGFVNGESEADAGVITPPAISTTATSSTSPGIYAIELTGGTANNYEITLANGTLTISKATATITLANESFTYDGTAKYITATTLPADLTVDYVYNLNGTPVDSPTDAGVYNVIATVNDANYQGTATATLTITRAAATITLADEIFIYDGTAKTVTASTSPAGLKVDYSYNNGTAVTSPTDAGVYSVAAIVNDPNYTGTASSTLTINKADQTISFDPIADVSNFATGVSLSATASSGLSVTFEVTSGTDIATLAGSSLALNGKTGTVTVAAHQPGDSNYNAAADVAQTFSVTLDELVLAVDDESTATISFSPNPVSKVLYVATREEPVKKVEIYDLQGTLLKSIPANGNDLAVDISSFKTGIYLVRVYCDHQIILYRMLVKK